MLIDYVNVKQGTNSEKRYSRGNTLPLIQRPFGMASFTLQTNGDRGNWFYHPSDCSLEAIRLTHQPSPWMGDYGQVMFLPQTGEVQENRGDRYSSYDNKSTKFSPSKVMFFLKRYKTLVSLTPTERCGVLQIKFPEGEINRLSVWSEEKSGVWEMHPETQEVYGTLDIKRDGCPENFKEYVYIHFDSPIAVDEYTYKDAQGISPVLLKKEIEAQIAISFISIEQAKLNLKNEVGDREFRQIEDESKEVWESYLGKIRVEGDEEDKKTFYSCMYRCFLFPQTMYEINEKGKDIHISMKDGKETEGVFFTNNGFWDTFRTLYPLYSILIPEMLHTIIKGYLNFYKDTGWLPKWLSPGERGTMPGTLIDGVMADVVVKDILEKEEAVLAYEGLKKHALVPSQEEHAGRTGLEDYKKYGYLPYTKYKESVSNTLDYMYGDFCIAQIADKLGESEGAFFKNRAEGYQKLFHPDTHFFTAKDEQGNWIQAFDAFTWGNGYCEGGPWQNGVGICFDMKGWTELFPEKEEAMQMVRDIFATAPEFKVGSYGCEIHEMTEMVFADFGQCAISNQPSFLLPYYPALLGNVQETYEIVGKILQKAFSEQNFPGDEDNGSMAAWYVLSSIGIYPYCPGIPEYVRLPIYWENVSILKENGESVVFTKEETEEYAKKLTFTKHYELIK